MKINFKNTKYKESNLNRSEVNYFVIIRPQV